MRKIKVLGNLLWDGEGEKALQCIVFFWQIADSRWLTSLVETVNVIGKKVGPGWGG